MINNVLLIKPLQTHEIMQTKMKAYRPIERKSHKTQQVY